jgi:6-phosphogluconolactonase (cycloisomerase 2 family)
VASSVGDAVAVFTRNATSGALGFVESKLDGPGSNALNGADGIAVSRDGDHVYVVASVDDAISAFRVGPGGALTSVGEITQANVLVDGLDGARGIALTADDRYVVVASEDTGGFSVFRRDPATGLLGFAQAESNSTLFLGGGLAGSFGVAASPDGRSVYVAGADDDALVVFAPEPGANAAWIAAGGVLLSLARGRRPR